MDTPGGSLGGSPQGVPRGIPWRIPRGMPPGDPPGNPQEDPLEDPPEVVVVIVVVVVVVVVVGGPWRVLVGLLADFSLHGSLGPKLAAVGFVVRCGRHFGHGVKLECRRLNRIGTEFGWVLGVFPYVKPSKNLQEPPQETSGTLRNP